MAKKRKKIVEQKIKYKKPVKSCNSAIDEIARIKRNEAAKVRRREKKEFEIIVAGGRGSKKRAAEVRKEINKYERTLRQADKSLKTVRGYCETFNTSKAEQGKIKAQMKRMEKKFDKLYEKKDYKAQKEVNNELSKLGGKLRKLEQNTKTILLKTNKELGFSYKELAGFFTKKQFQDMRDRKELTADEIEAIEEENDEVTFDYKEGIATKLEQYGEETEEAEDDEDWVVQLVTTLWGAWKDFDNAEVPLLKDYEKVIFEVKVEGEESKRTFNGSQATQIAVHAQGIWEKLRPYGSEVIASKFRSLDGTKLKYLFETL